jgi:hypothetical protein
VAKISIQKAGSLKDRILKTLLTVTDSQEKGKDQVRTIRIMPCLDMKEGRVVKGIHFIDLKDQGTLLKMQRFTKKKERMNWPCWISQQH